VLAIHPRTGEAHRFHEMNFEGKEELIQETLILNHRNLIDQSVPLGKTTVDSVGAEFTAATTRAPTVSLSLTAPAPPSRKRTSTGQTESKTSEPFCASSMKMTFADVLFSIGMHGLACRENAIGPKGALLHRSLFPVPQTGLWVEIGSFLDLARPLQRRLRRICAQCSPILRKPEAWPSEQEIRNLEALCAAVVVYHLPTALAGKSPVATPPTWEIDEKVFQILRAWDPPAAIKFRDAEKKKASDAAKRAKDLIKKYSQEDWKRKLLKGGLTFDSSHANIQGAEEITVGLPYQSLLQDGGRADAAMTVAMETDEKKQSEEAEVVDEGQDARDLKGRFWSDTIDPRTWQGEVESMISAVRIQEYVFRTSGEDIHCAPFIAHSGHIQKLKAILQAQAQIDSGTDQWLTSFRDYVFEESLSLECRSIYRRGLLTDLLETSEEENARDAFLQKARANSKPQV